MYVAVGADIGWNAFRGGVYTRGQTRMLTVHRPAIVGVLSVSGVRITRLVVTTHVCL